MPLFNNKLKFENNKNKRWIPVFKKKTSTHRYVDLKAFKCNKPHLLKTKTKNNNKQTQKPQQQTNEKQQNQTKMQQQQQQQQKPTNKAKKLDFYFILFLNAVFPRRLACFQATNGQLFLHAECSF